jgi:hypothetical protein
LLLHVASVAELAWIRAERLVPVVAQRTDPARTTIDPRIVTGTHVDLVAIGEPEAELWAVEGRAPAGSRAPARTTIDPRIVTSTHVGLVALGEAEAQLWAVDGRAFASSRAWLVGRGYPGTVSEVVVLVPLGQLLPWRLPSANVGQFAREALAAADAAGVSRTVVLPWRSCTPIKEP